jgi:hypothetical protein
MYGPTAAQSGAPPWEITIKTDLIIAFAASLIGIVAFEAQSFNK